MKRWAALVVMFYGLVLLLLTAPLLLCDGFAFDPETGWRQTYGVSEIHAVYTHWAYWIWLGVLLGGQILLLLVPLDLARQRPVHRRRLWPTVVAAGFFLGSLVFAVLLCLLTVVFKEQGLEALFWPGEKSAEVANALPPLKAMLAGLGLQPTTDLFSLLTTLAYIGILWAIWGFIFRRYAMADDPDAALTRATRWLLRGSALELLIAVPSHIIVRQRNECCAHFATFWAITVGFSVMLLSFGPGVFFLFARRMNGLRARARLDKD